MSDSVEPTTAEAPPATKTNSDLPDWARQQISAANQEAANYRVQLRTEQQARQALEEQVSTLAAEKAAASTTATSVQGDFDKLVTAIQAEVPIDKVFSFAKTLKGDSESELQSHAAELKAMFGLSNAPSPAVDRSQGLGGGSVNSDPASQFASFVQSNLTR